MDWYLILAVSLMISILWFGCTFLYFLKVIRTNSEEVGSLSLIKDINQLGRVHKTFLAIKRKQHEISKLHYFLVISNVSCLLFYATVIVVGIAYGIATDI